MSPKRRDDPLAMRAIGEEALPVVQRIRGVDDLLMWPVACNEWGFPRS